jgi:hypothetical protein
MMVFTTYLEGNIGEKDFNATLNTDGCTASIQASKLTAFKCNRNGRKLEGDAPHTTFPSIQKKDDVKQTKRHKTFAIDEVV